MDVSSIIYDVSVDLNDQVPGAPYLRWPKSQLFSYYQEALSELINIYKWDYYSTVVVPVSAGSNWQTACDCSEISRVIGESDAKGNIISNIIEQSLDDVYVWTGDVNANCTASDPTSNSPFTRFSLNPLMENSFKVYPPASPGQKRYVVVECYKKPDVTDENLDCPQRFVQAVKQWMLYRALIIDAENNSAIAEIAKTHYQVYQQCLKDLKEESLKKEAKIHAAYNTVRTVQNSSPKQVSSRT